MSRKSVSADIQTAVLVRSRRRCCICYGLDRDTKIKAGQIAHLDQNNSNNNEENLCLLCFVHHDEYDSTTRQRKNFTEGEIKRFRSELYAAIDKVFSIDVHFGEVKIPPNDPYAGQFIRVYGDTSEDDTESAEITLTPIPDGLEGYPRYFVSGQAFWGRHRDFGPNIGDMGFVGTMLEPGLIEHSEERSWESKIHVVLLKFDGTNLTVEEKNWSGTYGMNVNFIGNYKRVK